MAELGVLLNNMSCPGWAVKDVTSSKRDGSEQGRSGPGGTGALPFGQVQVGSRRTVP